VCRCDTLVCMATQAMGYSTWRDEDWAELLSMCRRDGISLNEDEIREAAFGYMHLGSDGGGNRWGLLGTAVALNVDKLQRERCRAS
jgi:hypothetical protein